MSLLDKEPVKRAEKSLKNFDQSLEVIVLDKSARTAQDAATALDCNVGAIVKSLLFKTNDSFILCLVAGDKRASLSKIKKIINKKDVSMANPEDVKSQTGYTIGGVSTIGHLKQEKDLWNYSQATSNKLDFRNANFSCITTVLFSKPPISACSPMRYPSSTKTPYPNI